MVQWISFEDLSGGGKSTAITAITGQLEMRGYRVVKIDIESSRGSPLLFKAAQQYSLNDKHRMKLFWQLRVMQFRAVLAAMSQVDIVITDRFWGSTVAIDHYGNGVPMEELSRFGSEITRKPDLTFFFEVSLEEARRRKDSPTLKDEEFVERTVRGYQDLARKGDWIEVDTNHSPEDVATTCLNIILEALGVNT